MTLGYGIEEGLSLPYGSYLSCGLKTQNFCHRKTRTDSGTSERNGVICNLQA